MSAKLLCFVKAIVSNSSAGSQDGPPREDDEDTLFFFGAGASFVRCSVSIWPYLNFSVL